MNNLKFFSVCISLIALLFTSCSKEYIIVENEDDGNSKITIRTRSATEDAVVAYPVQVYVFNDADKCIAVSTIESAEESISLDLLEGFYNVYAIAGVSDEDYDLPTKNTAKPEAVISLKDGKEHGDIMTASNTIILRDGEENTLTLSMQRRVILLQDIVMYNVPSKVNEVIVTIAPLSEGIQIDGTMSGGNGVHTKVLEKNSNSRTWNNSEEDYLLENASNVTITVTMKYSDETKSYSYTCPENLLANYKIKIYGAYTEAVGVTLNGTITGATWAGEKEISFSFDESGSSDNIETDDPTDDNNDDVEDDDSSGNAEATGDAPEVGSFYNGCYVLKHESTFEGTVVTFVSGDAVNRLSFTKGDQTSLNSAINEALADFSFEGLTGWRLPTETEVEYIRGNAEAINNNFVSNGRGYAYLDSYAYFYIKDDNTIWSFMVKDLPAGWSLASGTTDFLRPVTTMVYK